MGIFGFDTSGLLGFVSGIFGGIALYLLIIQAPGVLGQPPAWARIAGGTLFTLLFIATTAILLIGPMELPESAFRTAYDHIVNVSLFEVLVGLTFGAVASEWLRYILVPVQLDNPALLIAHMRWGLVLLVLLAAGALYPSLRHLDLAGASVSTPIGGISLVSVHKR